MLYEVITETLEGTNTQLIADFEAQYEMNPGKVGVWKDKALEVAEKGEALYDFIEAKKKEILESAGEDLSVVYDEHGILNVAAIGAKDKTDAPAFIMVGDNNDKEGKKLRLMMEDFRNHLVGNVLTAEDAESVITSYSIHYTKLYEVLPDRVDLGLSKSVAFKEVPQASHWSP